MEKQIHDRILKGAKDIAENLSNNAIQEVTGLSWVSTINENNKPKATKNETIYNGVCGILLFYLELYKKTRDEKYFETIVKGLKWVEKYCENHPAASVSLFTGRSSMSYFYLKMYLATGMTEYLEKALTTEKKIVRAIDDMSNHEITDYLNGISGRILGLISLHSLSREPWILHTIHCYAEEIFNRAYLENGGLCWDRSTLSIHGLCGFSHGASGVAKIFLELGNYLDNQSFFLIADKAFAYESFFYSKPANNWIDLRKMVFTEEDEKSFQTGYMSGDLDFFTTGKDAFNAWCHGAAGVGLVRLRAYELTKNRDYLNESELAIAKTIETDITDKLLQSFTLCHGRGGNADLFLESYRVLGAKKYWEYAQKIALDALEANDQHGYYRSGTISKQDTSLFLGDAGIGYFFLRTLDPINVPSILAPKIDKKAKKLDVTGCPFLMSSPTDIYIGSIKKRYPRTIKALNFFFPEQFRHYFEKLTHDQNRRMMDDWTNYVGDCIKENNSPMLQDVFEYEQLVQSVNDRINGDSLLSYKQTAKNKDIAELSQLTPDKLTEITLIMDTDLVICHTKWNWVSAKGKTDFTQLIASQPDTYAILLIPTIQGILEQEISLFPLMVLHTFKDRRNIEDGIQEVMGSFEEETNHSEARQLVIEQIRELIKCGFLLNPATHPLNQKKEVLWLD